MGGMAIMNMKKIMKASMMVIMLSVICLGYHTTVKAEPESQTEGQLNLDETQQKDGQQNESPQLEEESDVGQLVIEPTYTFNLNESQTEYSVKVEDIELHEGQELKVGIWSNASEQSDFKWNTLEANDEENTYSVTVPISDYKLPGIYTAHLYLFDKNEPPICLTGRNFMVDYIDKPGISADQDYEAGKATIIYSGMSAKSGIDSVRVAVWSADNQNDIHWYDAIPENDDWKIEIDLDNHKNNWSNYAVHTYATDGNGFQQYVGGTRVDFSLKRATPTIDLDVADYKANIELDSISAPGTIKSVRCAVWSEANGQDDLVWYNLDNNNGKWSKAALLKNLRSIGRCVAHIYVENQNGSLYYLGGGSFILNRPSVTSGAAVSQDDGTFKVTLEGLSSPLGVKKVRVAVWSQNNLSDFVWYTADKDSSGNYVVDSDISKHNYNIGLYNVHVYVTDDLDIQTAVCCTAMEFKANVGNIVVKQDPNETQYPISLQVTNYPMGLKSVEFAVWSVANGQDDARWYVGKEDNGVFSATVDITNHKTLGEYKIHAYGTTQAGTKVYLGGSSELSVNGIATGDVAITDKNDSAGTYRVVISNLSAPSGIESVRFAAWTKDNASDFAWYTAKRQSDGTYAATVDAANHQAHVGNYQIHVYATMKNGIEVITACTVYDFQPQNYLYVLNDVGRGKRTVGIANPASASNVRFAVWSEANGQDDAYWYTATQADDGSWRATILASNHKNGGAFDVHAYSGAIALRTTVFDFPADEFAKNGWYYETINGREYRLYYIQDVLQTDVRGIVGPQSSYKAEINRTTCTVTIYALDPENSAKGYNTPVKTFTCSVGLPSTPTPTGTYHTLEKQRWGLLMGPSYGQYCTRIVGGILFHSVAGSNMTSYNLSAAAYNMLGSPASHGCVRLCVRDAKWIYDNCALGMEVRIYDSAYAGPFGKPATIKIPASQNWDPTDPAV